MPQETNLNVSPYFDDFDASKNYYKVLFKPSFPVQARELTGLQSILQNQIEQFGNHIFKEGSVVIPGQINYNNQLFAVEVQPQFLGVSLENYINELVNKTITGSDTQIKAKILYVLDEIDTRNTYTLYITYLSSGLNGETVFNNSEVLLLNETTTVGPITIQENQGFATTIDINATSLGSGIFLSDGIYFLRGYFVDVYEQLIILDSHSTTPSYKVGFEIFEEIITYNDDETLTDNAQGFNNYAAPGSDRLKITAILTKKSVNVDENQNFVELLELRNGEIINFKNNPRYNVLNEELARRTYDTSGDYYVKPFSIELRETLNNFKGNNGIFLENELTYNDNVPSENLVTYKISPGKAFVKGFEIDVKGTTYIDVEKPRETKTLNNQSINYFTGSTLTLNRVYGAPTLDINSPSIVSLRDSRIGITTSEVSGKEIGLARVYDFKLESGSYDSIFPDSNQWEISLFDVQTYSEFQVNEPITLNFPTKIIGNSSGSIGFLRNNVSNSDILTVYDIKGTFVDGEQLIFDSVSETRIISEIKNYSISDVKSIADVKSTTEFNADVKLSKLQNVGSVSITDRSSSSSTGISTVTSSDFIFTGSTKIGDIVSYSSPKSKVPSYAVVKSVFKDEITISPVTTVSGVCKGTLPNSDLDVSDFKILTTRTTPSEDDTLYTTLPKSYISSVDLTDSNVTIRKQYSIQIQDYSTGIVPAGPDLTFLPFDEGRYVLTRSDGTNEILTPDKFKFTTGSSELKIDGLRNGPSSDNVRLIATLKKTKVKSKIKNKESVNSLIINKSTDSSSGIGTTTLNDGLVYGKYPYGTRVQDNEICLLKPDVNKILGIFESSDTNDPKIPSLTLISISGPSSNTNDLLIGEEIVGTESNAIGILVEKVNTNKIGFVYLNSNIFKESESIKFKNSGITANITLIENGSNEISNNYKLDYGYEDSIYNYSKIIRKPNFNSPRKKIKIIFESSSYSSADTGDITTANSYTQFDYCNIPFSNENIKNSDILDLRPRVTNYTISENTRSPFEFLGRNFTNPQQSSKHILASDEDINLSYSFYLPRIDRIYLDKDGKFTLVKGISSESPTLPSPVDDALEIANINLSPYLCNISNEVSISLLEHKRYLMKDIFSLENRIKKLEFFTTLSLLELNTKNLKVTDSKGLDRFKSGFIVDNFTTRRIQLKNSSIKNSIHPERRELRPSHYTTQIDLILGSKSLLGIGMDQNPSADIRYVEDLVGSGIKRTGQLLTLDYDDVPEIVQPFATKVESVTPFLVKTYIGSLDLSPSSDIWIDTIRLKPNRIEIDNFTPTQRELEFSGFDPQTGFGPVRWDSWQTTWTGKDIVKTDTVDTVRVNSQIETTTRETTVTTTRTEDQIRSGERLILTENVDTFSEGDSVVSSDIITAMRSRNIEFIGTKLKPYTTLYAFFDGINVTEYTIPKLIQIEMISGTFSVGETVDGKLGKSEITFKVAQKNHKYGPFDNPTDVFDFNPYNRETISSSYSSTSELINVDTFSLSQQSESEFYGNIEKGMILRGRSSDAQARIKIVPKLVTDDMGDIIGSFFIPDPNDETKPAFETGTKTFRLTSNNKNSQISGVSDTFAQTKYFAKGKINTVQERIVSVRNPQFETITVSDARRKVTTETSTSEEIISIRQIDPLAQSFKVSNPNGIFVTKVDVYFESKDKLLPVTVQLRTMSLGLPTEEIIPFSEVKLSPKKIKVSGDASVATTIKFPSPVYLNGSTEYAIVLLSDSTEYKVWISRFGKVDVTTSTVVSQQPNLGSLFKSQNGSTWSPSQYEDLKFTLYKAFFNTNEGTVNFYNPVLNKSNKQIAKLRKDSIEFYSRKIRICLDSTIQENQLNFGNTIIQNNTNASGNYVAAGGAADGTLGIENSGIGYEPITGTSTYTNIPVISVTGNGKNATIDLTITDGYATNAVINSGGMGYAVGDIVTVSSDEIGSNGLGQNIRLSISQIDGINEIIIDNVQGDFEISPTKKIMYYDSNNNLQQLNTNPSYITDLDLVNDFSDGLHIKVNHKNHGMHSSVNNVRIRSVSSDLPTVKLTTDYLFNDNGNISLSSVENLSTFENQPISINNPGYILIENEIISYTGISGNSLTGIYRGRDQTKILSHFANEDVEKYEINGISLRRINKIHTLQSSTISNSISLDSYYLKLDMSSSDKGFISINGSNGQVDRSVSTTYPKLYISDTKSSGKDKIFATQNISFETIRPIVQHMILPGTNINSYVRTITGTSISGNEISYSDGGFTQINLNSNNHFDSPRIVASRLNENNILNGNVFPANKSFTLSLNLTTTDKNLSPVIDLDRVGMAFITNRVNSAIQDYSSDRRVNNNFDDPTQFVYVTKNITLENPSTSLKIIVSAYVNVFNDVRAFYSISNNVTTADDNIYYPFPGYDNLDVNKKIIDFSKNNGLPDEKYVKTDVLKFKSKNLPYKDYEFTIENLPSFKNFSIKLLGTSTNQAHPPRLRDFRVIALA